MTASGLERFAEAGAIRDYASADPLKLADCSDYAVALKAEELLHHRARPTPAEMSVLRAKNRSRQVPRDMTQ
jgi:hypothetical protein